MGNIYPGEGDCLLENKKKNKFNHIFWNSGCSGMHSVVMATPMIKVWGCSEVGHLRRLLSVIK